MLSGDAAAAVAIEPGSRATINDLVSKAVERGKSGHRVREDRARSRRQLRAASVRTHDRVTTVAAVPHDAKVAVPDDHVARIVAFIGKSRECDAVDVRAFEVRVHEGRS
jgi:hypothetical protein